MDAIDIDNSIIAIVYIDCLFATFGRYRLCSKELKDLDMKMNSAKSCCLRIGQRTSIPPDSVPVNIVVDSSNVSWNKELR